MALNLESILVDVKQEAAALPWTLRTPTGRFPTFRLT